MNGPVKTVTETTRTGQLVHGWSIDEPGRCRQGSAPVSSVKLEFKKAESPL